MDATATLSCVIKDEEELYRIYMRFVPKGGLFISPVEPSLSLGDMVGVSVTLFDEEPVTFTARVVWLNPEGTAGHPERGVGVQFSSSEGEALSGRIEHILLEKLKSEVPTDTL